MYWNMELRGIDVEEVEDKLQHEMYWNLYTGLCLGRYACDKLQHEMYWNPRFFVVVYVNIMINYNMRCIEMQILGLVCKILCDKLQHEMYWNFHNENLYSCPSNDKLQHEMYWNETRTIKRRAGDW